MVTLDLLVLIQKMWLFLKGNISFNQRLCIVNNLPGLVYLSAWQSPGTGYYAWERRQMLV